MKRKGQSTAEYLVILCVVLVCVVLVGFISTIRSGFNGYFDTLSNQISPPALVTGIEGLIAGGLF